MSDLTRETIVQPAYDCIEIQPCVHGSDKCKPDSGGSHGRSAIRITHYIKGPNQAAQFVWSPRVYLNETPDEVLAYNTGFTTDGIKGATAYDLGWHAPVPEGPEPKKDEGGWYIDADFPWYGYETEGCDITGGRCFYSGSSLNAEEPLLILVSKGSDALFEFLTNYYEGIFG